MEFFLRRMRVASRAAFIHFLSSTLLASLAATLVLLIWYPYPYDLLSGGRMLFLVLVCVDVVCGPLLTLVLFSSTKSSRELVTDMGLVVLIQMAALIYGLHTAYEARPLFLAHEVDRFRVIALGDYGKVDVRESLAALPEPLRPHWLKGPATVAMRPPKDENERREVMLEAISGGRDYSQRPDFYVPYGATADQRRILARAKPLRNFIALNPDAKELAAAMLKRNGVPLEDATFLPVMHKQEWVVVMDKAAHILGFLPGDGFRARDL